jgi:hypothetical protein
MSVVNWLLKIENVLIYEFDFAASVPLPAVSSLLFKEIRSADPKADTTSCGTQNDMYDEKQSIQGMSVFLSLSCMRMTYRY